MTANLYIRDVILAFKKDNSVKTKLFIQYGPDGL